MPVRGDDDGGQRGSDPLGSARAEVLPGGAEDVVLLVGVIGRGEEVDEAPHQALLLRELLRVLPLPGLGTVILRREKCGIREIERIRYLQSKGRNNWIE